METSKLPDPNSLPPSTLESETSESRTLLQIDQGALEKSLTLALSQLPYLVPYSSRVTEAVPSLKGGRMKISPVEVNREDHLVDLTVNLVLVEGSSGPDIFKKLQSDISDVLWKQFSLQLRRLDVKFCDYISHGEYTLLRDKLHLKVQD